MILLSNNSNNKKIGFGLLLGMTISLNSVVQAANFDVTSATDDGSGTVANTLSWAISQANGNAGADTITLKTDIALNGVMQPLIDSDVMISSDAIPRTINGSGSYRPLFIKTGNVTLSNVTITSARAKGGNSTTGGGGAGLGGAVFVYDGTVSIENVTFSNNSAAGGSYITDLGKGGGGMYGNAVDADGGGLLAHTSTNSKDGASGIFGEGGHSGIQIIGDAEPGGNGGFGGGGGAGGKGQFGSAGN
jgi:hypothetical protein